MAVQVGKKDTRFRAGSFRNAAEVNVHVLDMIAVKIVIDFKLHIIHCPSKYSRKEDKEDSEIRSSYITESKVGCRVNEVSNIQCNKFIRNASGEKYATW